MSRRYRSKTISLLESTVYSFLLIGKTGNGKSSSGNAIIRKSDFFAPFHSTSACTKTVKKCHTVQWGRRINIVDTPGLLDPELDDIENAEIARSNMRKAFTLCPDGFNALLIVLNYTNTYNKEEKEVIETLTEIFGDKMFNSTILIFTHGDNFDENRCVSETNSKDSQREFIKWCHEVQGEFKMLLKKCNYRAVIFHNTIKYERERDLEIMELFDKVNELKQVKYTKYLFDRNWPRRNQLILKYYLPQLKDKIKKKLDELKEDFRLITHQNESLDTMTKSVLDIVLFKSLPQKYDVEKATTDLIEHFPNMNINREKFDFLCKVLGDVKSPIFQELGTLIANINNILNPEKHKNLLKRKVYFLLNYIKEESHGTYKLLLEEQRVKMFRKEINDFDIKGGDISTEIKY